MEKILCIRKAPGKSPEIIQVNNTLEALQKEVGGYIESVTIATDCAILCDEEGRLKGKPVNCGVANIIFVGTILVVGIKGEEFASLPASQIMTIMRLIFGRASV